MKQIKKFEIGKSYKSRSVCDHKCVFEIKVIGRTKKFITFLNSMNEGKTSKIEICDNEEICHAFGKYSMSPIFRVSSEVKI